MNLEYFTNYRYKVLVCMSERLVEVAGVTYSLLSQRQIANITGIAFKTVNNIMKELKSNGYIEHHGTTRGKYSLTNKANVIIYYMQKKEQQNEYNVA